MCEAVVQFLPITISSIGMQSAPSVFMHKAKPGITLNFARHPAMGLLPLRHLFVVALVSKRGNLSKPNSLIPFEKELSSLTIGL